MIYMKVPLVIVLKKFRHERRLRGSDKPFTKRKKALSKKRRKILS
jgi:hypothetical protein